MTILRVLTGHHAGVQIRLSASAYRIAADEEADIQLTDWTCQPTSLSIMTDRVLAFPATMTDDRTCSGTLLEHFVPMRFDTVVLCVGPSSKAWPSDRRLLRRLENRTKPAARPARRDTPRRGSAIALSVLAVLAVFGVFVGYTSEQARANVPHVPLINRVGRAVASLPASDLVVRAEGGRVIVEGLLPSSADVNAVRQTLSALPAELIDHRYASIAQISQSIVEAIRLPGATVRYLGSGVFALRGSAIHPEQVSSDAARVASDLAPLVKRIDTEIETLPAPERLPIGTALTSDGLQYVQTRDGTKYLELRSELDGESNAVAEQRAQRFTNLSSTE